MATSKKVPAKKTAPKKVAAKKVVVKKNNAPVVKKQEGLGAKGAIYMRVTFNDQEFKGRTDDIAATVRLMNPARINTKTIMQFRLANKKNGKLVEKVLMVQNARRIFGNDMAALILAKGVNMALGHNG